MALKTSTGASGTQLWAGDSLTAFDDNTIALRNSITSITLTPGNDLATTTANGGSGSLAVDLPYKVLSEPIDGLILGNTIVYENLSGHDLLITGLWVLYVGTGGAGTAPEVAITDANPLRVFGDVLPGVWPTGDNAYKCDFNPLPLLAEAESVVVRVIAAATGYAAFTFRLLITGVKLLEV